MSSKKKHNEKALAQIVLRTMDELDSLDPLEIKSYIKKIFKVDVSIEFIDNIIIMYGEINCHGNFIG